jgi:hypothetical protein
MDLFNAFINETNEQLGAPKQKWAYNARDAWKDLGTSELVLMKDAAYELGGSGKSAVNFTCVTDDKSLVSDDEILLYGPDLKDLKGDSTFARIAFLGVKEISKDEQEAFNTIQNMEFVKYHVFPEGYMMRVSPESNREQVRVSKKALKKGISFKSVGADYIKQYHTNPNITAVKLIFVQVAVLIQQIVVLKEHSELKHHPLEVVDLSVRYLVLRFLVDVFLNV